MADVTGSIGNEYVELNNAATEATLKQLLAAVQRQGGTGAAGKTAALECQNRIFDAANQPVQRPAYRCIGDTSCEIQQVLPLFFPQ